MNTIRCVDNNPGCKGGGGDQLINPLSRRNLIRSVQLAAIWRLAESLAAFRYDRKTPEGVLTLFAWIQKRLFDTRTIVAGVSSYPPRR
jgi:hypothetical protein